MDLDGLDVRKRITNHLLGSIKTKQMVIEKCRTQILAAAKVIVASLQAGGKILICGNGGSAADSQHLAAEFICRLSKDFSRPPIPAIALTTDTSAITAVANDFGFDTVFERQVEALGKPEDVLIAISTSGNSINVFRAVEAAHHIGMETIALLGSGGSLESIAKTVIAVPETNTQFIQEAHLTIEHILCDLVENGLYGSVA